MSDSLHSVATGFDVGLNEKQIEFAEKNLSNYSLVWLGEKPNSEDRVFRNNQKTTLQLLLGLQQKTQNIYQTRDVIECLRLLKNFSDRNVFLIITDGSLLRDNAILKFRSFLNVKYIYCFGHANPWNKYTGDLNRELHQYSLIESNILILPADVHRYQNIEDYDAETQLWIVQQLLLELLVRHETSSKTLEDFRKYLENIPDTTVNFLDEVEKYERCRKKKQTIQHYTKASPINNIVHACLRSHNLEDSFKIRHYLIELYSELKQLHESQLLQRITKKTLELYRGKNIPENELTSLRACIGQYVATNSFISTSVHKHVAAFWINKLPSNDTAKKKVPVIFCFKIDCKQNMTKPMANIKKQSEVPWESEYLMSMGIIFIIKNVIEINGIHEISLLRVRRTQIYSRKLLKNFFNNLMYFDRLKLILSQINDGQFRDTINDLSKAEHGKEAVKISVDDRIHSSTSCNRPGLMKSFLEYSNECHNVVCGISKRNLLIGVTVIILILGAIGISIMFGQLNPARTVQIQETQLTTASITTTTVTTSTTTNMTTRTMTPSMPSRSNSIYSSTHFVYLIFPILISFYSIFK